MAERRRQAAEDKATPRKFEEKINNLRRRNEEDRVQYEQLQAELRQLTNNPLGVAVQQPLTDHANVLIVGRSQSPMNSFHHQPQAAQPIYLVNADVQLQQHQAFPQTRVIVGNTGGGSVFATNNNNLENNSELPLSHMSAVGRVVPGRRASAMPLSYANNFDVALDDFGQPIFDAGENASAVANNNNNFLPLPDRPMQLGRSLPDMSSFMSSAAYQQYQYETQNQLFNQKSGFQQQQQQQQPSLHISQLVQAAPDRNFAINNNSTHIYSTNTSNFTTTNINNNKRSSDAEIALPYFDDHGSPRNAADGAVRGVSLSPRRLMTGNGSDLRAVSPGGLSHPRHVSPGDGGGAGGSEQHRSRRHARRHFSPGVAPYTPAAGGSQAGSAEHYYRQYRQHPYVSSSMYNLHDFSGPAGGGNIQSRRSMSPTRYMLAHQQKQQQQQQQQQQQPFTYYAGQQQQMNAGNNQQVMTILNNNNNQYLVLPSADSLSGRRTHSDSALHHATSFTSVGVLNANNNNGPSTLYYSNQQPTAFPSHATLATSEPAVHARRSVSGPVGNNNDNIQAAQHNAVLANDGGYQSVSPPFNSAIDNDNNMMFDADFQFNAANNQQRPQFYAGNEQFPDLINNCGSDVTGRKQSSAATTPAIARLCENLPDISISPPQVHEQQRASAGRRGSSSAQPPTERPSIAAASSAASQLKQQHTSYQQMQSSPAAIGDGAWHNYGTLAAPMLQHHLQSTSTGLSMSGSLPDLSQRNIMPGRAGLKNKETGVTDGVSSTALPAREFNKRSRSGLVYYHNRPVQPQQQQQQLHQFRPTINASEHASHFIADNLASGDQFHASHEGAVSSSIPDIVIGETMERAMYLNQAAMPQQLKAMSSNQMAYRIRDERLASLSPFPPMHAADSNNMDYFSNENSTLGYADDYAVDDADKQHAVSFIRQQLESVTVSSSNSSRGAANNIHTRHINVPPPLETPRESPEVMLEMLGQIAVAGTPSDQLLQQQHNAATLLFDTLADDIDFNDVADLMLSDMSPSVDVNSSANLAQWPNVARADLNAGPESEPSLRRERIDDIAADTPWSNSSAM